MRKPPPAVPACGLYYLIRRKPTVADGKRFVDEERLNFKLHRSISLGLTSACLGGEMEFHAIEPGGDKVQLIEWYGGPFPEEQLTSLIQFNRHGSLLLGNFLFSATPQAWPIDRITKMFVYMHMSKLFLRPHNFQQNCSHDPSHL